MFSEPLCHGRCLGADVAEARIGSVAVAAAADVVGVAGNADDARFRLFSEGAGLVYRFDFFALGRSGQDERRWILGAVGCASGSVCGLAAHSRQGSRVRPFVFMTNLPTMEKTESRMMRFVLAQQAKRARLFFTQLRFVRASILMGQPGDD